MLKQMMFISKELYFLIVMEFCIFQHLMSMKKISRLAAPLSLMLIISVNALKAQSNGTQSPPRNKPPDFKKQGEQEHYEAKELFARYYKKEVFKGFKGKVLISGDTCRYREAVVILFMEKDFRKVFESGIFYPGLVSEAFNYEPKIKIRGTQPTTSIKSISSMYTMQENQIPKISPDTLRVSLFEELKFLEKVPQQRRFKFWMFTKGLANPTVYFIELTNQDATRGTSILSFIDGAKVTFFKEGWIII